MSHLQLEGENGWTASVSLTSGNAMTSLSTQTIISDMLLELARGRDIDKITVKDIAESCGITRQTFYYHFHDILDVFEWSMEEQLREMMEKSLLMDQPRDAIRMLLEMARERAAIVNRLMQSEYRNPMERVFVAALQRYFKEMIERRKLFQHVFHGDLELAVRLNSYALIGLLIDISRDPSPDLDAIADQMVRLLDGAAL